MTDQCGTNSKLLVIASSISLLAAASQLTAQDPPRPNVILIMTDDQGYGDFGITGNPIIRTPNIDQLARESAIMENFYVSPVCAPTRASLMTGRYNYRTRVVDTWIGRAMMEPEEVTVAEVLQDFGYATGIFGKWHLGDCYPMRPIDQGFDVSVVHRGGGIGQPSDPPGGDRKYTDPVLFRNGVAEQFDGYCTDIYFDEALHFIDESREKHKPFFVYVATNAPHGPFHDVPPDAYERYRDMNLSNSQFPQEVGSVLPEEKGSPDVRARIFAMISNIDQNVGRMIEHLRRKDLLDNTLVIFMVDNGPNERRFVSGLRGMKASVYEGGIRSPLLMHWPARLKPGATSDRIAAHIDIMPSILDACGVAIPPATEIDGRSVLPLLEQRSTEWPDRAICIQSHRGDVPVRYHHFALRTQEWKLVHASGFGREQLEGDPKFELFHISEDPFESNNIADENPEVVQTLRARYDEWFDDVSSSRPENYDPPRIHVGSPHERVTVLTRQDWRHHQGGQWAPYSRGRWMVHIERPGPFSVRCRFSVAKQEGAIIVLQVGDRTWEHPLTEGAVTFQFEPAEWPRGDTFIEVFIREPDDSTRGSYQVEVASVSSLGD